MPLVPVTSCSVPEIWFPLRRALVPVTATTLTFAGASHRQCLLCAHSSGHGAGHYLPGGWGRVDSSGGLCPQVSFGLHGTREAMGGEVFPTSGRTSAQAQRGASERVCRALPNLTDSYSPIPRALKIHGG